MFKDFSKGLFLLLAVTASVVFAPIANAAQSAQNAKPQAQLKQHFQQFIEQIDHTLFTRKKQLKTQPEQLKHFVEQQLLPQWDSQRSLKYLLGKTIWKQLKPQEIAALTQRFDQTLQRYIREGMGFYDGQRMKLVGLQLNKRRSRGLLTLRLEPIYLPAFNIQFKIAPSQLNAIVSKNPAKQGANADYSLPKWQFYDILIKGISFIKIKKGEYRRIIQQQGIAALLQRLDKNNGLLSLPSNAQRPTKNGS